MTQYDMLRPLMCSLTAASLACCSNTTNTQKPTPGVIYETYKGENYESAGWHRAESSEAFEKLEVETHDLYAWSTNDEGYHVVRRECSTPSGDWFCMLDYTYDSKGRLMKIDYEFRTFAGYEKKLDDFLPTGCIRVYEVTPAGQISLSSETIFDLESGKEVERGFHDREFDHWMSLAEVPKPNQ